MARLSITLLGSPQIALDGVPIKISTHTAIPLLAYLAVSEKSQTRETLSNLFWSETSQSRALASLRTTLWRLKSSGLEDWIRVENSEISLNYQKTIDVDVLQFKANLHKCGTHGHPPSQICLYCASLLTEAIDLYQGEFLAGVNLTKAQFFDDWRSQENETLHLLYLDALEKLVRCHRTYGDFNQAIQYARILVRLDHYNENAQYDLLQLYSITGQRASAINQYKHYKELLGRDLAIEPSEEITSLYKQILVGKAASPAAQKVKTPVFLIADIENAARLWVQAGVNKDNVLTTYHDIFTETSRRFGGHILQRYEDSLTVLFENGHPLHCAVTIHLRMKKTDWGAPGSPHVRMVLYSTTADESSYSDFAMITQAASRLLSISWGGQIVFSEQTLQILDLPSGSRIQDLGYHALKDITDHVHVYELLHPHLPQLRHPPLQSVRLQAVNLPTFTPGFVGREAELEKLADLLNAPECRMISLVGPGGTGKTRLAVQFAAQVRERFPDGTFFISLAPIQDPNLIPIVLADVVKFSFYGTQNHRQQLADYLHRLNVLLIFDSFEHLRLEGTDFLTFLLDQTHNLKIAVTTRERLNVLPETVLEVGGLPVPSVELSENLEDYSSVKLFLHNAQRTKPRFSLKDNAAAVIRICQLVNGLPLGIMLASSWVQAYSCSQIADEIHKNIDFLDSSSPEIAPRQRSLRAVFDNSWQLLSQEERRILRQLAIFPASFTYQAAQEICGASTQMLTAYIDKSLLQHRSDRYEMLDTFRQYALSKLIETDAEYDFARQKFTEYYTIFCEQKNLELNSSSQHQALDEIMPELQNIRAAWNWMVESGRWDMVERVKDTILTFHIMCGLFIPGREFFRIALGRLDGLNDPSLELIRAYMQQFDSWMAIRNGFLTEGMSGLLNCLEIFRTFNSSWDIARTLMFLADASYISGNNLQGKEYIEEALRCLTEANLPQKKTVVAIYARCQSILGSILIRLGEYAQAELNLQASLATHQVNGTHYGTIHPLLGLGRLAYLQGELTRARDLYLQALETATNLYDQRGMALLHNNLGAIYEDTVNITESYHHVSTALKLCRETGDRRLTAVILNNLAYHQLRYQDRPAEAIRTYQESIDIFTTIGDLRGITYSYYDISKAYLRVGLLSEAFDYCNQSLNTALTLDNIPLVLHALHGFAHLYARTDQLERALRLCYLIINHSQVESDTRKRAIVSRVELEALLPSEAIQSAQSWAESTGLQGVVEQIRLEKSTPKK